MSRRNLWAYAWPIPFLVVFGPRSFAWRRRVWGHWLPAWEAHWLHGYIRSAIFAIRSPRFWWLSVRISAHVRLGFPMPRVPGYNAVEM